MPNDNNRNTILFIVGAAILFLTYQFLVLEPARKQAEAEARAKAAASAQVAPAPGGTVSGAPVIAPSNVVLSRAQAVAASPRVRIDTPALSGSVSLKGARIDDLYLKGYRQALDKPDPVELFRPEGAKLAYFAQAGWEGLPGAVGIPGPTTLWTQTSGDILAPGRPVTLTYDNGQGLLFRRTIAVDDKFMFTITDTAGNQGSSPVVLRPYSAVVRQGLPDPAPGVHEGAVGIFDGKLKLKKYKGWKKEAVKQDDRAIDFTSTGGWLGITDKYWLAAVIPEQKTKIDARFMATQTGGRDVYQTSFVGPSVSVGPGLQTVSVSRLFAGAKNNSVLQGYEASLGIPRFDDAIDWGEYMFWATKPIFWLLEVFYGWVGNFGLAILMMTVVVRAIFFYPANLSFESMTKMKKVQPQVDELRKKHKDDPAAMQKEMMGLYAREKINPLLGCLPMLATIPVFFALYMVLNVTIEMRHAPFYGIIQDLSAPDPSSIWNLFGLIPWNTDGIWLIGTGQFLHIGIWAIAYGVTTWLYQSMSPPAPDPTQQKIMMMMPIIFTFILAQFAVGLLIYYTWSNILTLIQQYIIMRRFKVDNPIDQIIRKVTGKPAPAG